MLSIETYQKLYDSIDRSVEVKKDLMNLYILNAMACGLNIEKSPPFLPLNDHRLNEPLVSEECLQIINYLKGNFYGKEELMLKFRSLTHLQEAYLRLLEIYYLKNFLTIKHFDPETEEFKTLEDLLKKVE
jgi:hypothetical protein